MVPRWRACRGVVGVVASQRPHGGVVAVSVTVREREVRRPHGGRAEDWQRSCHGDVGLVGVGRWRRM